MIVFCWVNNESVYPGITDWNYSQMYKNIIEFNQKNDFRHLIILTM